jgi:hypothetical protein
MDFMSTLGAQVQGFKKPATSLGFPNMMPVASPAAAQAAPVSTSAAPIENRPVDVIGTPQPAMAAPPAPVAPAPTPAAPPPMQQPRVPHHFERMGLGSTISDYLTRGGNMRDVRDAMHGLAGMAHRQMGAPGLIDILKRRLGTPGAPAAAPVSAPVASAAPASPNPLAAFLSQLGIGG